MLRTFPAAAGLPVNSCENNRNCVNTVLLLGGQANSLPLGRMAGVGLEERKKQNRPRLLTCSSYRGGVVKCEFLMGGREHAWPPNASREHRPVQSSPVAWSCRLPLASRCSSSSGCCRQLVAFCLAGVSSEILLSCDLFNRACRSLGG